MQYNICYCNTKMFVLVCSFQILCLPPWALCSKYWLRMELTCICYIRSRFYSTQEILTGPWYWKFHVESIDFFFTFKNFKFQDRNSSWCEINWYEMFFAASKIFRSFTITANEGIPVTWLEIYTSHLQQKKTKPKLYFFFDLFVRDHYYFKNIYNKRDAVVM